MLTTILCSGSGGQGALTVGNVLGNAAMYENFFVSYLPCYGAAMRGGTANCTTSISTEEIASPVVSSPDVLIALNKPSVITFLPRLKPGTRLIYNADLIDAVPDHPGVACYAVAANRIGREAANERSANMVMLGAMLKVLPVIKMESLIRSVQDLMGSKKALASMTIKALQGGYDSVA
ncbi:MAG TPA: 2-oxoacid:acceptor oxidoreductase family protein [Syntrophales bacterium]|nr:2-oxoacid:acceptor oxidoreductase family protein [Syntrophales bacterium]